MTSSGVQVALKVSIWQNSAGPGIEEQGHGVIQEYEYNWRVSQCPPPAPCVCLKERVRHREVVVSVVFPSLRQFTRRRLSRQKVQAWLWIQTRSSPVCTHDSFSVGPCSVYKVALNLRIASYGLSKMYCLISGAQFCSTGRSSRLLVFGKSVGLKTLLNIKQSTRRWSPMFYTGQYAWTMWPFSSFQKRASNLNWVCSVQGSRGCLVSWVTSKGTRNFKGCRRSKDLKSHDIVAGKWSPIQTLQSPVPFNGLSHKYHSARRGIIEMYPHALRRNYKGIFSSLSKWKCRT